MQTIMEKRDAKARGLAVTVSFTKNVIRKLEESLQHSKDAMAKLNKLKTRLSWEVLDLTPYDEPPMDYKGLVAKFQTLTLYELKQRSEMVQEIIEELEAIE